MNEFPIRVNRRDADKHFHPNNSQKKKVDSDIKIFRPGARHYLHPALSILDKIDCELVYYKSHRIMVVSYDPKNEYINNTDYIGKVYDKCVMSGDVDFIADSIHEYIEYKRKSQEDYNDVINSNVHSETNDNTMGETII